MNKILTLAKTPCRYGGVVVSTVGHPDLGDNHRFETALSPNWEIVERYNTYEDALIGHKKWVHLHGGELGFFLKALLFLFGDD
jgi:hypothetical protein